MVLMTAPLSTGPLHRPPAPELQPAPDISPAVAAALLQLISQQGAEPRGQGAEPQLRDQDAEETAGALASSDQQVAPGSPDSPETPPGDGAPAAAQFPRDQDLRFSRGAPREPGAVRGRTHPPWKTSH
ncbi:hypothetical protein AAFF_G00367950 [Aldrovandia affinis]|uniref:Uncharacterized protein n=1 Tax=Aldrovandia affinis TaxID=143900 RepID=A0AAD7VZA1_9TELE|nr:hypothetical protein AAFF_G00367950 [Aldrovandia affinis]